MVLTRALSTDSCRDQRILGKRLCVQALECKQKNVDLAKFYDGEITSAAMRCSTIAGSRTAYQRAVASIPGGRIATRLAAWKAAQNDLLRLQAAVDQKKIALNAAQEAYDDEIEALAKGTSTVDKVKKRASR